MGWLGWGMPTGGRTGVGLVITGTGFVGLGSGCFVAVGGALLIFVINKN
jgi:hypothetical protein